MKPGHLVKLLRDAERVLDRIRGSHHVFRHPERPGIIVAPHPRKDLGEGLVAAIRKKAGV